MIDFGGLKGGSSSSEFCFGILQQRNPHWGELVTQLLMIKLGGGPKTGGSRVIIMAATRFGAEIHSRGGGGPVRKDQFPFKEKSRKRKNPETYRRV